MDKPTRISESAVRSLVKELLQNDIPAVVNELPAPIEPSPDVDTTYRVHSGLYDVPIGTELVPKDKRELEAVLKDFLADVPEYQIPALYHRIQRAFDETSSETGEGITMKNESRNAMKRLEERIRKEVRRILEGPEMKTALNFSGWDAYGDEDDDAPPIKRVSAKARASGSANLRLGQADKSDPDKITYPELIRLKHRLKQQGGGTPEEMNLLHDPHSLRQMSHDEMVPYLGVAGPSGVKGEEYKALQKAAYIAGLDPSERKELFDTARDDYIEFLESSGDLTPDEVDMLYDNPAAVEELEGFRDWLDAYIWDGIEAKDPEHYIDPDEWDRIHLDKKSRGEHPPYPKGPKGEPIHKRGDWKSKQYAAAARSTRDRERERSREEKGKKKDK